MYGITPPPVFSKRESAAYRRRFSSPSAASSSSSSRVAPAVPVKMELYDAPTFAPGDFVDDNHLGTVIGLVSQTSRREADKAEEWRLVAKEHGKMYVDLGNEGE